MGYRHGDCCWIVQVLTYNESMATRRAEGTNWHKSCREMASFLWTPHFMIHFLAIVASPFWLPAAVYFFFRLFIWSPSGFIAWLAILTGGCYFVGNAVATARRLSRSLRAVRSARRAVDDGELGSRERLEIARVHLKDHKNYGGILSIPLSIQIMLPPILALMFWSQMQLPVGLMVNKRLVICSRSDRLRQTLRNFERRGIFTPFHR